MQIWYFLSQPQVSQWAKWTADESAIGHTAELLESELARLGIVPAIAEVQWKLSDSCLGLSVYHTEIQVLFTVLGHLHETVNALAILIDDLGD